MGSFELGEREETEDEEARGQKSGWQGRASRSIKDGSEARLGATTQNNNRLTYQNQSRNEIQYRRLLLGSGSALYEYQNRSSVESQPMSDSLEAYMHKTVSDGWYAVAADIKIDKYGVMFFRKGRKHVLKMRKVCCRQLSTALKQIKPHKTSGGKLVIVTIDSPKQPAL